MKKIIEISAISHTFDDGYQGIKNVSLSIYEGEFIILAGKNGSGKTTLLRHLNGLLFPDAGHLRVNGHDVKNHLVQTRRTIGMVFQDTDTQIVGDTVFDEVAFGLENLKFDRAEINDKVTCVLKNLSLFHLKDRTPFTLSGGEKKKLAIAGILVMDPQVIVFDEPFSNLDYPGTREVLTTILALNRSGQTIIIATHDVETVIYDATRIIIMDKGLIREDGAPADIVRRLESWGVRQPCSSKFGRGITPWLY